MGLEENGFYSGNLNITINCTHKYKVKDLSENQIMQTEPNIFKNKDDQIVGNILSVNLSCEKNLREISFSDSIE